MSLPLPGHVLRNALLPGYRLQSLVRPGTRLAELLKEGNQCHEPAGSPEGGQFCGGDSSGKVSKEEADKTYNAKLDAALATLQAAALTSDSLLEGEHEGSQATWMKEVLLEYKDARAQAQAEWKASQAGTKTPETAEQKVFGADQKLYESLKAGADPKAAYAQWKQDTASEKAGTLKESTTAPKEAAPPVVAPAAPVSASIPVTGVKPEPDITGKSAREATHMLLATGRAYTVQELMERTKTNEANVRRYLSQMQNPKWAAQTKDVLTLKREGNTFRMVSSRAPLTPDERAALKGTKTEQAKIGTNEVSAASFSKEGEPHGSFFRGNQELGKLLDGAYQSHDAGTLKASVSVALAERLKEHADWNRVASVAVDTQGSTPHHSNPSENLASRIIGGWASTAADSDDRAKAMQLAARDEFKMADAKLSHLDIKTPQEEERIWNGAARAFGFKSDTMATTGAVNAEDLATFKSAMRAYTRAEYEHTQAFFKEKGITEVSVFRGMKLSVDKEPAVKTYQGQPLASFSSRLATSQNFGSTIFMATFPVSHVLSTTLTGRGCLSERELVVLGHPIRTVRSGSSNFVGGASGLDAVGRKAFSAGKGLQFLSLLKVNIEPFDDILENADWPKQTWDLPPYKSPEFNVIVIDLENFRRLPVYRHAVANGLIVNDTWVEKK